jgi:hypothetical protein
VSAVPDELSPEVGGLQDTATNLGAAIGTALAGALLITALTTSFLQGVQQNPAVPDQVKSQANVQLAGGFPSSPTRACGRRWPGRAPTRP